MGAVPVETALERYEEAMGLVDVLAPDDELATGALVEAVRHRHPVYDPLYAILARRHGCSVLTRDERLVSLLGVVGIPLATITPLTPPDSERRPDGPPRP